MIARLLGCFVLLCAVAGSAAEPIVPEQTIKLLPDSGLAGWESYLQASGREDPRGVFKIKEGVLHISGDDRGYLATRDAYANYHLSLEYQWGQHRSDDSKYVRNSGVLLHAIGEHGNAKPWMTSVEVQLAQGCEGDLILIRGKDASGKQHPATLTSNTKLDTDKRTRWDAHGTKTVYSGKQFWWNKHDPTFEELLDTRGRWDVASPLGKWTKVDCICRDDKITIQINGQTVNEVYAVQPSAGRILLQNEGYELFFRNVTLSPLEKASP
ncbi:MAG TPA: DUF1080 domain-containing protein [Pirellulaceae bacterium]|nr:DUF1080 domain-containing protein [Pirellulaceae bacterium]